MKPFYYDNKNINGDNAWINEQHYKIIFLTTSYQGIMT